jgi:hypothetical protein
MRRVGIVLTLCVALAACAEGSPLEQAARDLTGRVSAIRQAVKDGDAALAGRLLVELEGVVDQLEQQGLITEEKAAEIHAAADDVVAQLQLLVSPTLSPSPSEDPGVEGDEDHSGPGHGGEDQGDGHAYGHDKD